MLAAEMPAIPALVADEVRAHFLGLGAGLSTILRDGEAPGVFRLGFLVSAVWWLVAGLRRRTD